MGNIFIFIAGFLIITFLVVTFVDLRNYLRKEKVNQNISITVKEYYEKNLKLFVYEFTLIFWGYLIIEVVNTLKKNFFLQIIFLVFFLIISLSSATVVVKNFRKKNKMLALSWFYFSAISWMFTVCMAFINFGNLEMILSFFGYFKELFPFVYTFLIFWNLSIGIRSEYCRIFNPDKLKETKIIKSQKNKSKINVFLFNVADKIFSFVKQITQKTLYRKAKTFFNRFFDADTLIVLKLFFILSIILFFGSVIYNITTYADKDFNAVFSVITSFITSSLNIDVVCSLIGVDKNLLSERKIKQFNKNLNNSKIIYFIFLFSNVCVIFLPTPEFIIQNSAIQSIISSWGFETKRFVVFALIGSSLLIIFWFTKLLAKKNLEKQNDSEHEL